MTSIISKSCKDIATSVLCILFVILPNLSFAVNGEETNGKDSHNWVSEAGSLINKLSVLSIAEPDTFDKLLQPDNKTRKAHIILWNLWLTTGMPPLNLQEKPFNKYLLDNEVAYRNYIKKHKDLNLEQINHLGIENASSAIGTSLWYMTTKYLSEKASIESEWHFDIQSTPSYFLVESPLIKEDYSRLSSAFSKWLVDNKDEMVWDADAKRFRPRHGKYKGTDKLFQLLAETKEINPLK